MFEGLLKPKFVVKCKGALKLTKTRVDEIRKKRRAVDKFMKNDIAELLRTALDYNAYQRAEALLIEKDRTACYDLIDQCCNDVLKNISVMQKQMECPEECREAVASLIYSAARLADLPELRDLRTLFTGKYGKSIEPFVSKELVQKLKGAHPTKELKLQLMHDIAHESGIDWDSKALEQRLFKSPSVTPHQQEPGMDNNDETLDWFKSKMGAFQKRDIHYMENKVNDVPEMKETDAVTRNKHRRCSSSDKELNEASQELVQMTRSSVSEDEALDRKLSGYGLVPPPYVKAKARVSSSENGSVAETRPKARPVRRRDSKLNIESEGAEEEKTIDGLLMHCSSKESLYDPTSLRNASLKLPHRQTSVDDINGVVRQRRNTTFESSVAPDRTQSEIARGHVRAASLQPDMLAKHVHPKLPDYDDLAARLAVLRG